MLPASRPALLNYVRIARPSYWFKNVFMLPGTAVALLLQPTAPGALALALPLLLGVISVCLLTSANYVINEYLDAEHDRHHPTKRDRPTAQGLISGGLVALEYALLAGLGLVLAWLIGQLFLSVGLILLAMGLIYNLEACSTASTPPSFSPSS
jgi:decaprenyl-phosphate phosphoribosyltransferase